MTTILVWLGSGFAFAIGVVVGAWSMSAISNRGKAVPDEATKLLAERNNIGREQTLLIQKIVALAESQSPPARFN